MRKESDQRILCYLPTGSWHSAETSRVCKLSTGGPANAQVKNDAVMSLARHKTNHHSHQCSISSQQTTHCCIHRHASNAHLAVRRPHRPSPRPKQFRHDSHRGRAPCTLAISKPCLPSQGTKAGDCGALDLSRGYTEQQEWVWSLSSTLGREEVTVHGGKKEGRKNGKVSWGCY